MLSVAERVELTTSCGDTNNLDKVADAGMTKVVGDERVQVMHNGVLVVEGCYYGGWMTEIIQRLRGHHEPQEEIVFDELVRRVARSTGRPTMIELGAFWGYYSLWLLHEAPDALAVLVEPDPHNLDAGRRNFALNGRTGHFVQAAVGPVDRPPQPFVCESDGMARQVPVVSLQGLIEQFALDHVDLLLLDVQGAETAFLEGAASLLADRVRFVVVSTHHHTISGDVRTHQRCLEVVRRLRGTCHRRAHRGRVVQRRRPDRRLVRSSGS